MFSKFILLFSSATLGLSILGFLFPKLRYGIVPRTPIGLIGIVCSPMFHKNPKHLLSNSIPFVSLVFLLYHFYPSKADVTVCCMLVSGGVLLWLFGKKANHIGASGLIYGLAGFLITQGFISSKTSLIGISIFIILIYGSLWKGLLPFQRKNISWEGHFLYAIAGILSTYLWS